MLIPSIAQYADTNPTSLSRRVNANSQPDNDPLPGISKLIKKGEC